VAFISSGLNLFVFCLTGTTKTIITRSQRS
jgi:hypothetical protein